MERRSPGPACTATNAFRASTRARAASWTIRSRFSGDDTIRRHAIVGDVQPQPELDHDLSRLTSTAITEVEKVIRGYIRLTPVLTIDRADFGLPPGPLTLKLELTQHSGSFKV